MIHLAGPGGAGKSTTGPILAARLTLPFKDLDVYFAEHCGNIDEFIASQGYVAYARANVGAYERLLADGGNAVIILSS